MGIRIDLNLRADPIVARVRRGDGSSADYNYPAGTDYSTIWNDVLTQEGEVVPDLKHSRFEGTLDVDRVIVREETKHYGKSRHDQDTSVEDFSQGMVLKSPDGHVWRVQVDNTGALITTDLGVQ